MVSNQIVFKSLFSPAVIYYYYCYCYYFYFIIIFIIIINVVIMFQIKHSRLTEFIDYYLSLNPSSSIAKVFIEHRAEESDPNSSDYYSYSDSDYHF